MINKKYNIDREIKKAEWGVYFHLKLKGMWWLLGILYFASVLITEIIKYLYNSNIPLILPFVEALIIYKMYLSYIYIKHPKTYEKMHILKLTVENIIANIEQVQSEGEEGISYIATTANLRMNEMRHSRIKNIIRYIERNL